MSAQPVPPIEAAPSAPSPKRRAQPSWLDSLQSLLTTVTIAVFVITFIVQAFQIPSGSMEDTLQVGDYVLVDKVHFGNAGLMSSLMPYDEIRRDDIIVFRYPVHPEQHFVKRVIGLPGDHIKLLGGRVYVNDQALYEPYVVHKLHNVDPYRDNFPNLRFANPNVTATWYAQLGKLLDARNELIVPEHNYFVLGDNRDDSSDSRYWGFVPQESVLGRPLLIYFSVGANDATDAAQHDDRLVRFAYFLGHITDTVRWRRCLRLIH